MTVLWENRNRGVEFREFSPFYPTWRVEIGPNKRLQGTFAKKSCPTAANLGKAAPWLIFTFGLKRRGK